MGATSNQQPWTDRHTQALIRAIIANALASRSTLYAHPDLQEVSNNGGDRINKKLQQLLKGFAAGAGAGAEGVVAEALGKLGRSKGKVARVDAGQGKKDSGGGGVRGKKRKVDVKEEEEGEADGANQ